MTRPFGGDKIGFEATPIEDLTSKAAVDARAVFLTLIAEARKEKRRYKDAIEKIKETKLDAVDKVKKEFARADFMEKKKKCFTPAEQSARLQEFESLMKAGKLRFALKPHLAMAITCAPLTEDEIIGQIAKDILREFHFRLGQGGWTWSELSKTLSSHGLVVEQTDKTRAYVLHQGVCIGTVWFGDLRLRPKISPAKFGDEARHLDDVTLVQVGYEKALDEFRRRKEYVLDSNGVPTRRFVRREIAFHHLATMVGLKWSDVERTFKTSWRERGQYPRDESNNFIGHTIGDDRTVGFDIQDSAMLTDAPEFPDGFTPDGHDPVNLPRTGHRAQRMRTNLQPEDQMNNAQRAATQIRNGSGPQQPQVSAATVQPLGNRLLARIRGNKGERFDNTEEAIATVEVDIAILLTRDIPVINAHAQASHKFKVAFKRLEKSEITGDIKEKRSALAELDELIASAEKNREVTMDWIPNEAVVAITPGGEQWKWDGCQLQHGKRYLFDGSVQKAIDKFFTAIWLEFLTWDARSKGTNKSAL